MLDGQWETGIPLAAGKTTLKLPSDNPGELSLTVRRLSTSEEGHRGPLSSGEDQDGHWKTYLGSMQVKLKGKTIEFPSAMITPLNEPHWVRVQTDGGKLYIIIDGLDAAASYRAIFTVDNGIITQRLVAQGEFSHQIWERTQYHDDFDDHPERYKNM